MLIQHWIIKRLGVEHGILYILLNTFPFPNQIHHPPNISAVVLKDLLLRRTSNWLPPPESHCSDVITSPQLFLLPHLCVCLHALTGRWNEAGQGFRQVEEEEGARQVGHLCLLELSLNIYLELQEREVSAQGTQRKTVMALLTE